MLKTTPSLEAQKFPYRKLISLTIPIALHKLINSSMPLIDSAMISRLDESALTALGACNQVFLIFFSAITGIADGTALFSAQYWGDGNIKGIRKMLGLSIVGGLGLLTILAIALVLLARPIMEIITGNSDPQVVQYGVDYIRITTWGYLFLAVTNCYTSTQRSINQPRLGVFVSVVAIGSNAIMNYIFIFGKLGFPAMGIKGAAIATVISMVLEMFLAIFLTYRYIPELAASFKELFSFNWELIRKTVKVSLPVTANNLQWALGTTFYVAAYNRISTSAAAAVQVANSIQNIFAMFCISFAVSAGVIIGNKIGEGREDLARAYSKKLLGIAFAVGVGIAIILVLARPLSLLLFEVEPHMVETVFLLLVVVALILPFRSMANMVILAFFSAGGATRVGFLIETAAVWLFAVPLCFIAATIWKWPVHLVLACSASEQILKFLIALPYYRSFRWLHNLTNKKQAAI